MKIIFQLIIFALINASSFSQTVSGIVRDDKGEPLPNASVLIKDKKGGTTCNVEGKYFLNLSPGNYTLIAQHVGYKRDVRNIKVEDKDIQLDFVLSLVDFTMEEVVVRSGENPANEIIRKTIQMRRLLSENNWKSRRSILRPILIWVRCWCSGVSSKKRFRN